MMNPHLHVAVESHFDAAQVEYAYLWRNADLNFFNVELLCKRHRIGPGESMMVSHNYRILPATFAGS